METIVTPPGIGDILWVLQTLDPSKKYNFQISNGVQKKRGHKMLELVPDMVNGYEYIPKDWATHATHECNRKFIAGYNIEDIGESINWNLPIVTGSPAKSESERLLPDANIKYIGIYASSYNANLSMKGWSFKQWHDLTNRLFYKYDQKVCFVFMGADYDDQTLDLYSVHSKNAIGIFPNKGESNLPLTIELLKRLDLFICFQSGLGCLSTYFDLNTVMLFSPKYPKLHNSFCRKSSIGKTWKGVSLLTNPLNVVNDL